MPHHVMGLGWDEVASIITVFSVIFGIFTGWLVHTVNDNFKKNAQPLNQAIEKLRDTIELFKIQLEGHQKDINQVSERVDNLSDKVNEHDTQIKIWKEEEEHHE